MRKKTTENFECNDGSLADGELITAYLDGNATALETLFERYRRPLYSYLNRMFDNDTSLADDVFQETWIHILNALPKFKDFDKFSGWCFRIAHNQAMQNFRRAKSRSKIGAITADGELPENVNNGGNSPEHELNNQELAAAIEQALQKLPPEQREVFTMRQNGIGFKDIAELQKCPLNTALSRMRYVMLFMRRELAELWQLR